jgi:acetyl-CoA acetyltransferase
MTVNRFCGSSMSAIHYAAGQIQLARAKPSSPRALNR